MAVDNQLRVLAILPAFIPSTIIGVVKPLLGLHRRGQIEAKFALENTASVKDIDSADIIVFCRNTEPAYGFWLDLLDAADKPYIYELDDNLFKIPIDSALGEHHRNPKVLQQLTRYVEGAALVRVYSESLYHQIKQLNPRLEIVSGSVDLELVDGVRPRSKDGTVRIVYVTSRMEDELSQIFLPVVQRILDQLSTAVEVHYWGNLPSPLLDDPRVNFVPYIPDYDRYMKNFRRAAYDIGLAPLQDDEFHSAKSNNKFREYGACSVAGVYSHVAVYSADVTDGVSGLLVPNESDAWYEALIRLVKSESLRQRITENARARVVERYSLTRSMDEWIANLRVAVREGVASPGVSLSTLGTIRDDVILRPVRRANGTRGIRQALSFVRSIIGVVRRHGLKMALFQARLRLYQWKMLIVLRLRTSPLTRHLP